MTRAWTRSCAACSTNKERYQTNDLATLHVLSFVNVSKICKCFLVMTCDRFAKACAHLNINSQYELTFMSNCRIFGAGKVSSVPLSLQNCVTLSVIEPPCWAYANHLIFMTDLLYSNRYLTELRCVSSIFHKDNFFFHLGMNKCHQSSHLSPPL